MSTETAIRDATQLLTVELPELLGISGTAHADALEALAAMLADAHVFDDPPPADANRVAETIAFETIQTGWVLTDNAAAVTDRGDRGAARPGRRMRRPDGLRPRPPSGGAGVYLAHPLWHRSDTRVVGRFAMSAERDALARDIAACRRCPGLNVKGKTGSASGYGCETSPVMLVGQSLCKPCMITGIPFTGGAGRFIEAALDAAGQVKEDVHDQRGALPPTRQPAVARARKSQLRRLFAPRARVGAAAADRRFRCRCPHRDPGRAPARDGRRVAAVQPAAGAARRRPGGAVPAAPVPREVLARARA
jgi:hypothetical protein